MYIFLVGTMYIFYILNIHLQFVYILIFFCPFRLMHWTQVISCQFQRALSAIAGSKVPEAESTVTEPSPKNCRIDELISITNVIAEASLDLLPRAAAVRLGVFNQLPSNKV